MSNTTKMTSPIGSIYLPSNPGTPVGRFDFIVDVDGGVDVEIGTPVAAETSEGVVVGAVVDMRTVGTGKDPVASDLGGSYDLAHIAQIPEVMVATVQVFHSPTMRPVRSGLVRPATADEMLTATGYHTMDWPVPAGAVALADGTFARVCYDGHALLGPSSAHVAVGGLSGMASKTSYMGALLKSAIESGSSDQDSVAALIFNVKGEDLLFMDEPPAAGYELQPEDMAIYAAMGIAPEPFDDVRVYAPSMPGGASTRSARLDASPLRWDLVTIWPYLRHFFPGMDWYGDDKLQAFLNDFAENMLHNPNPTRRIDTLAKLESWMDERITESQEVGEDGKPSSMAWKSHHIASFRRFKRMLTGLAHKGGGLITKDSSSTSEDIPVKSWRHGEIIVVDIAGLQTDVQGVVIARTVERLMKAAENGELGVDHLAIITDEANAYLPNSGGEMATVRKAGERVATQGRYSGLSLWFAAQSLSKVSELVVTNASTRALGRTADLELASGAYGRLSAGVTERIATMPKGRMMLWHYTYRAPLMVRFPRPAWKTGKPKAVTGEKSANRRTRPEVTASLGLRTKSLERLVEGIPEATVERIVSGADDPAAARRELERSRVPDMNKQALHEPSAFDPTNPFNLDDI